ncbi:ferric-rhodotorulic acid/ferric-coprogen receptor FhuE [Pantoea sp. GD03673]|uniref:ferric-rhodotorulic acid/ferric-coprogen receptor FhuE n=1 Tax=Pantoea sp. GD03673 TaxID=2975364 RepID=UPI002448C2BD|nr:ferric-rhodotorulic acid/ferric-coprogen receptor FhuE [Pantoea sp. GD03673]MDH2066900.1 ferric-rhodotorulic acid/ferric-coprogen receptor FhuE [Pantoea sp. GD03673]
MSFTRVSSESDSSGKSQSTRNTKFAFSVVALMVSNALFCSVAHAAELSDNKNLSSDQTLTVTADEAVAPATSAEQSYTVPATRAGTKLNLTQRDIPQSVSTLTEQRIKDQNLQNIGDALANVTGISASQNDSERVDFYSRGFYINNYTYDDIPSTQTGAWNFGETDGDSAIYERIDVVRGSTGLMTGTGNPGAAINMIRKKADSKTFTGNLSTSYGTWDNQRYVADLSGPLNDAGTLRGRVVTGYQDQDSWVDRYHKRKKFLYATVAADLTESTTLDLGYDYQSRNTDGPTWGGLPTWYSNGSKIHYDRSDNPSADWTHYNILSRKVFANLTTNFDNGWQTRINGTHSESDFDSKLLYVYGYPDQQTGILNSAGYGYAGWYKGVRTQTAIDAYATGPFELLGRQHQLVAGVDYSRQRNKYIYSSEILSPAQVGNWNEWSGNIDEPQWPAWALSSEDTIRQKSAYTAARFSLADPLSLIVGARYTQYSANGTSSNMDKNNITPYGGLVYDINETYSAFASYTSIFQPQTYRDQQGNYLKPVTGRDYETGIKGDWDDGQITSSLSVFRIEQENLGQIQSNTYVNNSSENAYRSSKGVVSRGVDFEINGAVTENLKMTFGATRYVAKDASGERSNPYMPQTSLKLFTSYNLPVLRELTVGGGINWQNRTYKEATNASGETERVYQGSYPIANLFARYQVNKNLSVQGNVKNIFDREYNTDPSGGVAFNEPRNYSVSLNYNF